MKTSVLIITNSIQGLLSFRKELLNTLIERGYNIKVAAPFHEEMRILHNHGIETIPVYNLSRRGINPFKDLKLLSEYKKIIKTYNPSIVLTYTIKPNIYGGLACTSLKIPYIVNITGLGTAVEEPGLLQKLTIGMYKMAMRGASCIFFQNKANLEFFKSKGIRPDLHQLIPGSGVNIDHHRYQPYPSEDEPIRFLYISRLIRQKGIDEYLATAEAIKKSNKKIEFHILGSCEKEYEGKLETLRHSDTVIYHGRQKDVRPFIAKSHCLIHPSFYPEGMSNVVLESEAAGRPVITTRRPGCQEPIEENVTGFLITPQSTGELIQAVKRFIKLPYEEKVRMGYNARAKVAREFNREIVVGRYLKEIDRIINSKS